MKKHPGGGRQRGAPAAPSLEETPQPLLGRSSPPPPPKYQLPFSLRLRLRLPPGAGLPGDRLVIARALSHWPSGQGLSCSAKAAPWPPPSAPQPLGGRASRRKGQGTLGLESPPARLGPGRAAEMEPRGGGRGGGGRRALCCLWATLLLAPPRGAGALKVEDTLVELDFFQESFPSEKKSGEFLLEFDNEEILHVDWEKKQNVWRLPDFQRFTSFEVQGALANIAVMKNNMEVLMKRSNRTRALNVAPSATVYPENAVELGDPNVLICFVDRFSPPVLNVTWLKNNEVVSEGVEETDFYPSVDNTFRKFSYLPFVPEQGDIYVCQVEHWGIPEGKMEKIWVSKAPSPIPETMENVLCALGLAFGILGIIAGTILFFKAMRMNDRRGFI